MTGKDDKELLDLLTKLYAIQEDVGAKPKSSMEEKRHRAESTAMMGRGKAAKKAGSRFLELKSTIVDRLKTVHGLLQEDQAMTRGQISVVNGNNPKEVIARQAQIREQIKQANTEWEELNSIYKSEARKKRSKFSQEELDTQQTLVQRLYAELSKVRELQKKRYGRSSAKEAAAAGLNIQALNVYDLPKPGKGGSGGWASSETDGVELTHQQHQMLQTIQSRDEDFDMQLDQIGEGIQDLAEIAQMQNEEVKRQNQMLDNVGTKIDAAHDHIENVNAKMKETLQQVRSADKVCVDIMCIVLMVGLAAVLYQIIKKNGI
jgi:SYP7 family syntaxin